MNNEFNYTNDNWKSKSKKLIIILCLFFLICVCFGVLFIFNKKDEQQSISTNEQTDIENANVNANEKENTSTNISSNIINDNATITASQEDHDENGTFLMAIEDIYTITGRATVVTGTIERGTINVNDSVQIIGLNNEIQETIVTAITISKKQVEVANAGDNVGLLLKGISESQVQIGQVVAEPDSINNVTKFEAKVYVLSQEESGSTATLSNNHTTQFHIRTADVTGTVFLQDDIEMVYSGEHVTMLVKLYSPVALEIGTEIEIIENNKTIGSGTITKIY